MNIYQGIEKTQLEECKNNVCCTIKQPDEVGWYAYKKKLLNKTGEMLMQQLACRMHSIVGARAIEKKGNTILLTFEAIPREIILPGVQSDGV